MPDKRGRDNESQLYLDILALANSLDTDQTRYLIRLTDSLCWGLTTRQLLWVILCRLS